MSQSISIRRDGDLIVIEDHEHTADHTGVVTATYMDAETAVHLFTAGLQMAREIQGNGKQLPLSATYDLYPEDAKR